jgi:hypothetical protein
MRELTAALLPDRSAAVNRQNEKYGDAPYTNRRKTQMSTNQRNLI